MPKLYPPETKNKIIEMYTTPASDGTWIGTQSIAKSLGMHQATVYNILEAAGVKTRSRKACHENGKVCKPVKNIPQGIPPLCKCGCGNSVAWSQRRNKWEIYTVGHYRKDALYKNREWLYREYVTNCRMLDDISAECGVNRTSVARFLDRFGIPTRTQKESLALSGAVRGSRNPAWKGGVAKWDYAHNWKRIARQIRKRDNYACQICYKVFPKSSKLLHVHHKDGDKFNNSPDNLVCVCATCHPKGKRKEQYTRPEIFPNRQYIITRRGNILGYDPDEWMTTREAADLASMSQAHLIQKGKKGKFRIEKKGGFWYVHRQSFDTFLSTYIRGKHR